MQMRFASVVLLAAGCGRIGFAERAPGDGATVDMPGTTQGFSNLVAYGDDTCAEYGGRAYCWGANASGQVGDGTTTNRNRPTGVSLPTGALHGLTIGETHGCAIVETSAYCWGEALGVAGPTPARIDVATAVTDIAAGQHFTCMVTGNAARCWGVNDAGQLGNNSTSPSSTPVEIASVEPVVAVDAGDDHACARTTNNTALCWGHNDDGALGNGSFNPASSPTPLTVTGGITTIPRIAGWHACTLRDGAAWCWGRNAEGELGDNTTTRTAAPQPVPGLDMVSLVATGGGPTDLDATCAIRLGEVSCWGSGVGGRLGTGSTANSLTPFTVPNLTNVVDVALGYAHTCALLGDGRLWCWGRGTAGQLGNGSFANSLTPVEVAPP